MSAWKVVWRVGGMVMLATAAWGCTAITAGVSMVPEVPVSTAEFRTELEMVENAELVVEDTMPRWAMGRCAYRRGVDRLLVLTHLTLLGERNREGQMIRPVKERFIERLWITIPRDTLVGQALDVEELDFKHLVGYDAGEVGDGLFREPYKVTGHVAVLEEREGAAVVYVNVQVAPRRRLTWAVKGRYEVKLVLEGVYAREVSGERELLMYRRGTTVEERVQEPVAESKLVGIAEEAAGGLKEKGAGKKGEAVEGKGQDQEEKAAEEEGKEGSGAQAVLRGDELRGVILGKWIFETPNWYDRLQFEEDGTFLYANCRAGGYAPAIHIGEWKVQDQFIIVTVKELRFGDVKGYREQLAEKTTGYLRARPVEDGLWLEGEMLDRWKFREFRRKVRRAIFLDMRVEPPPRLEIGWQPGPG